MDRVESADQAAVTADLATVFEDLDAAGRQALLHSAETLTIAAGGALIDLTRRSHGLMLVRSGGFGSLSAPDGPTLLARGDVVAEWAGLCCLPPLVALESSQLTIVPWSAIDRLIRDRPGVETSLRARVSHRAMMLQLGVAPLFAGMTTAGLASLSAQCAFVSAARGEVVVHEGDPSDSLYILARGSLEVFRAGSPDTTVAVLGDGACIGEMGVLTSEPRSTSVRARRTSMLIRVPAAAFDRVLSDHAPTVRLLARVLSGRLQRMTHAVAAAAPAGVIALMRACPPPVFAEFCERTRAAFDGAGRRTVWMPAAAGTATADETASAESYAAWIETADDTHDHVLCPYDDPASARGLASLQQADLILIVGQGDETVPPPQALAGLAAARRGGARVELALVRRASTEPSGVARWLGVFTPDAHHHLEATTAADYARLVRRLSGRAWGLVLGGGGARGLAHIGVIRALTEARLPVDMIAGSSMGAILSALYAMGRDDREMLEISRRAYCERSGLPDLTIPLVAVRSGQATAARLAGMFGSRLIEELPLPWFCVSCNLTRASVEVHDRGPVALWTRASCSVPGLLPPVVRAGDVLVDGSLLDSLPVAEMRRRVRGRVAAVDVSVAVDLAVSPALPTAPAWSGTEQLRRRISGQPPLPSIGEILMRCGEIASVRDSRVSGTPADLYLHVPLDEFGMSDFTAVDRIVDVGYRHTIRELERWSNRAEWQNA